MEDLDGRRKMMNKLLENIMRLGHQSTLVPDRDRPALRQKVESLQREYSELKQSVESEQSAKDRESYKLP